MPKKERTYRIYGVNTYDKETGSVRGTGSFSTLFEKSLYKEHGGSAKKAADSMAKQAKQMGQGVKRYHRDRFFD